MSCRLVSLFALSCLGLALAGASLAPRCGHAVAGERVGGSVGPHSDDGEDLYHWSRLPVRIYIPARDPQEQEWSRIAVAGFDEWVRASHGVIGYRLVDSPSQAQITVRFAATSVVPDHPDLVGLTTTFWVGPVLQSAEIVLATGQKSAADLQTAAAHELGHALGIRGHSEDPDDLMYPAPIRNRTPTAHPVTNRDLTTLKRCYPALFVS